MAEKRLMMPTEGRQRVAIEDVRPNVDDGRFAAKRVVGEVTQVRAAIFADGHDHVRGRIVYRREADEQLHYAEMRPLGNDLWEGEFVPNEIGLWSFRVIGWVDHFDTWAADLSKRISVSSEQDGDSLQSGGTTSAQAADVALALAAGAELLFKLCVENPASEDVPLLQIFARSLQRLSASDAKTLSASPVTGEWLDVVRRNPDLRFATHSSDYPLRVDRKRAIYSSWYEFFARSAGGAEHHGNLRDAARLIPSLAEAGFNVIYLPPIHPIGTAFRKGRNNDIVAAPDDVGSPWAIGDSNGGHTAIAPELGGFPDFDALLSTADHYGVEIALDIAFQCSPDHPWVKSHPDWFLIRPDGSIQYAENPPKKYQDIYPLNFESDDWRSLWVALSGIFLFWAKRGVRIFRVDNPHTKALPFWEWCISKVQRLYPDVIFLSEAFTKPHLMYGLAKRGFTQSYTYFTWRNTKEELTSYLKEITSGPIGEYFRPNFWPNTPDILPFALQIQQKSVFVQRAVLAATLTANYGVYGPAFELMEFKPLNEGREEYADSEKYQIRDWNRDDPSSLMPLLTILNKIREEHLALQQNKSLHFHDIDNPKLLCYSKRDKDDVILVVVNLDAINVQSGWTRLDLFALGFPEDISFECQDLLQNHRYLWDGTRNFVRLDPLISPAHIFHVWRARSIEGIQ
jgi:starch synthase (maltosyl-transferring)